MERLTVIIIAVLVCSVLTGCVYSHVLMPYDINLDRTVLGPKQGKASTESVLWLVAWGDGSTAAAAKQGGITTISHMDREVLFVLWGLYSKTTTIVYGE